MAARSALGREQRRFLVVLGLPALGMAMAVTVISTYLPVLVEASTNAIVVAAMWLISSAAIALTVPLMWSQRGDERLA